MSLTSRLHGSFAALAGALPASGGVTSPEEMLQLCEAVERAHRILSLRYSELRAQLRPVLQLPGHGMSWEMVHLRDLLRNFYPARRKAFMRTAELLAASGFKSEGAKVLARVLRTRPDLRDVHDMLRSGLFGTEAAAVSGKHRLCFRESFGEGAMTYPYGACADPARGRLFVSDHNTGELHRFDLETKERVSLRGEWGWLMGICLDGQGCVWMCDIQARALVRVDQDGRLLARIRLPDILGAEESTKPEFVSVNGDVMHVLAADSRRDNVKAFSFNPRDPSGTLVRHPALGLLGPAGIHESAGEVLYASVRPPCVYAADPRTGATRTVHVSDSTYNYQFDILGQDMFVTHTEGVARVGADGRVIWDVCLTEALREQIGTQGVATMRKEDGDFLYLVDFTGKRVLAFNV